MPHTVCKVFYSKHISYVTWLNRKGYIWNFGDFWLYLENGVDGIWYMQWNWSKMNEIYEIQLKRLVLFAKMSFHMMRWGNKHLIVAKNSHRGKRGQQRRIIANIWSIERIKAKKTTTRQLGSTKVNIGQCGKNPSKVEYLNTQNTNEPNGSYFTQKRHSHVTSNNKKFNQSNYPRINLMSFLLKNLTQFQ